VYLKNIKVSYKKECQKKKYNNYFLNIQPIKDHSALLTKLFPKFLGLPVATFLMTVRVRQREKKLI